LAQLWQLRNGVPRFILYGCNFGLASNSNGTFLFDGDYLLLALPRRGHFNSFSKKKGLIHGNVVGCWANFFSKFKNPFFSTTPGVFKTFPERVLRGVSQRPKRNSCGEQTHTLLRVFSREHTGGPQWGPR